MKPSKSLLTYATGVSPERLNDVEAEAQAANAAALAEGQPAPCMGAEIHCALFQASFNSISWAYTPEVIGVLVEKGVWSVEQACEAGCRHPWGALEDKWTLREIADQIPAAMREEALQVVLDHIPHAYSASVHARIIADIAPFLTEAQLEEALHLSTTIYEYNQAESIAGLARYLTPRLLEEAEAIIREFEMEGSQAKALMAFLPHFISTNQEERVQAVIDLVYRTEKHSELAAVLLAADHKEEALAAVRAIGPVDPKEKVRAVYPNRSPDEQERLEKVHAASWAMSAFEKRLEGLRIVLPHLNPDEHAQLVADTLIQARALPNLDDRVKALLELRPHLPDEQQESVVAEALDIAEKLKDDEDKWVEAVCLVAPHLPRAQRKEFAHRAFEVAQSLENPYSHAFALINVAPLLSGPSLTRLFNVLKTVKTDYQEDVIAAVAPHLSDVMFPKAWAASARLYDKYQATHCLKALAEHWPASSILEVLKKVRRIRNKDRSEIVLGSLVPRLAELGYVDQAISAAQKAGILMGSHHLTKMAPYLPASALEAIIADRQTIQDTHELVEAIGAFIPNMSPEARAAALQTALSWAPDIQGDQRRVHAWAALLPHLPEDERAEVYAKAWAEAEGEVSHAKLAPLAPDFDLEEAIRQAYSWTDTVEVKALIELVKRVPSVHPGREALIKKAQDRAGKIKPLSSRAMYLSSLVPHLTGETQTQTLHTVLELAEIERWPWHPAELTDTELEEMFLYICDLKARWLRIPGFAALMPRLQSLPLDALYALWREALPILAQRKRQYLLADLCELQPIIIRLGSPQAVDDIAAALYILKTSQPGQWTLPSGC